MFRSSTGGLDRAGIRQAGALSVLVAAMVLPGFFLTSATVASVPGAPSGTLVGAPTTPGSHVLAPANLAPSVRPASGAVYNITTQEAGLPPGTNWTIEIANVTRTSSGRWINFTEPNGSWPIYLFPVNGTPGYAPWSPLVYGVVNGSSIQWTVTYSPRVPVRFVAAGLPVGSNWSVSASYFVCGQPFFPCTLTANDTTTGTQRTTTIYWPRGNVIHFSFTAPAGYGLARVNGPRFTDCSSVGLNSPHGLVGPTRVVAQFARAETVFFNETIIPGWPGLPVGTGWNVQITPLGTSCGPGETAYNVTTPSGGSVALSVLAGEHYHYQVSYGIGGYAVAPVQGGFVALTHVMVHAEKFRAQPPPPAVPAGIAASRWV